MTSNIEDINSNEMNSSSDLQLLDTNPDSINAESDNDSGIVAIANIQRIGSTASNSDEDHIFKDRLNHLTTRSLSYGSKLRVRFDDELPLSEQNMRKSCKKLFETLKSQNKDNLITTSLNEESTDSPSLLPSCHCHHFKSTLPSIDSKCCAQSTSHLKEDTEERYDDNEFIITTYGQQCNYAKERPVYNRKYNSLDYRHRNKESLTARPFDCDAALARIKKMSDRLESSSMVNAFARPAFIKSAEFGQTMDTVYETIYPTERDQNVQYSTNSQVNQWLNNNNKVETPYEDRHQIDKECMLKSKEVNPSQMSSNKPLIEVNTKKPLLRPIPNEFSRFSHPSPSKEGDPTYIYPDQFYGIYPDNKSKDDTTVQEMNKFETSLEEAKNDRFSHSYSAGDDMKRGILRQRLKPAISEFDLNQRHDNSSPKSKSFLQRFKSVFSRAFNNEKLSKQSALDLNTIKNSKCYSQSDLSTRGSRISITGRGDRSPSFVKNIRSRISFRRTPTKQDSPNRNGRSVSQRPLSADVQKISSNRRLSPESDGQSSDSQVWGELIKLNSDSSQVIQIHRQMGRAFGFFVARGTVNNVKGVFVSRMKDELTQKSLTGVLEIGDEILAIDGESVKEANIMRVNQLITNKDTIRLTIIPYMNNKYL